MSAMIARAHRKHDRSSLRAGRIALWLAAIILLFNAVMPLTRAAIQQAQAAAGIEQIVICSTLGFRTLAMKDGVQVDTDPAKAEKMGDKNCPVCAAAANVGHAILPAGIELTVAGTSTTVLYGAASQSTPARADYRLSQARAPPTIA
jgi:hypothetical protein